MKITTALVVCLLAASAFAADYTNVGPGSWDNPVTWGSDSYPQNSGDNGIIVTGTVSVPDGLAIGSGVNADVRTDANLYFGFTGTHDMGLVLGGGTVEKDRYAAVTINGPITATAGTTSVVIAGLDQSMYWNGAISGSGTIGKQGDRNYGGALQLMAASPDFSGNWEIREGRVMAKADGALRAGAITVAGYGMTDHDGHGRDAVLDLFTGSHTGVGPSSILVRNDVYPTRTVRGVIGWETESGGTCMVDWSNDPVTTLAGGAFSTYRTTVDWHDPIRIEGYGLHTNAIGGNLGLYGPISSDTAAAVFEINGHNGSYTAFHVANPGFTGTVKVTRGTVQSYVGDFLPAGAVIEVGNGVPLGPGDEFQGIFEPKAMPALGAPQPTIIVKAGGQYGTRADIGPFTYDIELAGGHLQTDAPTDVQGDILVSANSSASTVWGTQTISGQISGAGRLALNNFLSEIHLTNAANASGWTGGMKVDGYNYGWVRILTPGAQGAGPIEVGPVGRLLFWNTVAGQHEPADWTIANKLTGSGLIQVETAANTLTTSGGVAPGASAGTLWINGNFNFALSGAAKSAFDVEVEGKMEGDPAALHLYGDLLQVSGNVGGLADAKLRVAPINAALVDLQGQVFTILTCANDLTGQKFGAIEMPANWGGPVTYGLGAITLELTIAGDATMDGAVDYLDLGLLAGNYRKAVTTWGQADFNYDGQVDYLDLGILAGSYRKGVADVAGGEVPEPVSLSLLALGAGLLLRRRRN